jgi:hypothetical protein
LKLDLELEHEMNEEVPYGEAEQVDEPAFPNGMRVAARIWIYVGMLGFLGAPAALALLFATGLIERGVFLPDLNVNGVLLCVFLAAASCAGIAFYSVGRQTLFGTMPDTRGGSIASLGIGFFCLLVGCLALFTYLRWVSFNLRDVGLVGIFGVVGVTAGICLLAAGHLALTKRHEYLAWFRSQDEVATDEESEEQT